MPTISIYTTTHSGKIIKFDIKTMLDEKATVAAIKTAVNEWANDHASGEFLLSENGGVFNWGDFFQAHEIKTLKRRLKIHGIKKVESEMLDYSVAQEHDENFIE